LAIAGQCFVYMLHPTMGSTHFIVEHDNSYHGWKNDGGAFWVNEEILQLIINAIEGKKKK